MRRFLISTAGLAVVATVAAAGVAALRDGSMEWYGTILVLNRVILGSALVIAVFHRGGPARAFWIGFALFGWGWNVVIPPRSQYRIPDLPTTRLLLAAKPFPHRDPGSRWRPVGGFDGPPGLFDDRKGRKPEDYSYLAIGDELWALVAALLGGILGRVVFGRSSARAKPSSSTRVSGKSRIGPLLAALAIAGIVLLVLVTSIAALRSTGAAEFWAGATFALVSALAGLSGLAAIDGRRRIRPACLGAALLGGGYLLLVFAHETCWPLPTGQFLHALRVQFPGLASPAVASSVRILEELERPIPMEFPDGTPLADLVEYVEQATGGPGHPGIPIYLDPIGMAEAERTPDMEVSIDVRGLPLKVTLRVALHELGLDYEVDDGLLRVISGDSRPEEDDPFYGSTSLIGDHQLLDRGTRLALSSDLRDPYLVVGHCLLAIAAAGLGAAAGRILGRTGASLGSEQPARS